MPLAAYQARILAHVVSKHGARGRIGFLGRPWPSMLSRGQAARTLEEAELTYPEAWTADEAALPVDDKLLCAVLGFTETLSIDTDLSEGAEILHDLNVVPPPAEWESAFDVIYNNGTMEHIFDVFSFFKNCFHFLNPTAPLNRYR
jgi:hypothetical protein